MIILYSILRTRKHVIFLFISRRRMRTSRVKFCEVRAKCECVVLFLKFCAVCDERLVLFIVGGVEQGSHCRGEQACKQAAERLDCTHQPTNQANMNTFDVVDLYVVVSLSLARTCALCWHALKHAGISCQFSAPFRCASLALT